MQPVSSAIYIPESWTEILQLDKLFPSAESALEVEIGCGKGRFLLSRASSYPHHNFLGIDKMLKRLKKVDRKIRQAGLRNVKLLRIEAAYAVDRLIPPLSVSRYYIFFPDPWPKRRHHARRLFCPAFMDSIHKTLVPGGLIYLATDHVEYSKAIQKLFSADQRFSPAPLFEPTEEERTEFETLFLQKETPIDRAGFRKKPD